MFDLPPMSSRTSKLVALLRYTNSPRQSPSGEGNTRYSPRLITLAKSASSLTTARPRLSFAVPKSSNQCSGLSMQWSTRALPSGNGTTAFFTAAENVPVTWTLPANRPAKDAGLVLWPKMPMLLEKPTTPIDLFDVPITPLTASDVPRTPAMFDVVGTAGPWVPEMPLTPVSAPEMLSPPGPKNETARMAVLVTDAPPMPPRSREKPMTPGCVLAAPSTPARKPAGTGGESSTWP